MLMLSQSGYGQDGTETVGASSGAYLRIANLLPISSKPLTIKRGSDPFLTGAKPGFMLSYSPISAEGGSRFSVLEGERPIGDFTLEKGGETGFYTAVVYMKGPSAAVVCLRDDRPPEKSRTPAEGPPPPPLPRFRGYFGAFDFPYRVVAGRLGPWEVKGQSVIVDLPVEGEAPRDVSLLYVSKDGDPVIVHFPINYAATPQNSVFVSQRGEKRPRLRSYPDSVIPAEESVAPPADP